MNPSSAICAMTLRTVQTGVEMADMASALPAGHPRYVSPAFLAPNYVTGRMACPGKGTYWLIAQGEGYEAVCTCHSPREAVAPLIIDTFICRILQYTDYEFLMAAQGKRTGLGALISMCINYPLSKAWSAYSSGKAIDCSGLAIEAMRDALTGLFREPALLADAGARTLGHLTEKYKYTQPAPVTQRPSAMADPTQFLQPGDICIVTPGQNMAHTTIYLGCCRSAAGDNTPYWIWASTSKGKIAVFSHEEYRKAYADAPAEKVMRWKLTDYQP